ncbi:hypothetical protein [Nereida ignava]|nr:hypothetical protein [Nereida ignava]
MVERFHKEDALEVLDQAEYVSLASDSGSQQGRGAQHIIFVPGCAL